MNLGAYNIQSIAAGIITSVLVGIIVEQIFPFHPLTVSRVELASWLYLANGMLTVMLLNLNLGLLTHAP